MNKNANNALNRPHKSRSGARKNSRVFMTAMITIWVIAFSLGHQPLKIQMAMIVSAIPISLVNNPAWASPMIRATIC